MPIPVKRLNHAVLFVSDPARSAEFYQAAFGFEVLSVEMGGQAVFMRSPIGGNHHDLGLFKAQRAQQISRGAVPGLYHLAWQVDEVTDLVEARKTLADLGALVGESDHGASLSLYGQDPDGIEFEIMWAVPEEAWGEDGARGVIRPLNLEAAVSKFSS